MVCSKLGKNFWLYRVGQFASVLGDSCGILALSWWVLDKTGSASQMALIMGTATFFRVIFLILFSPFGDRFSRKWLIFLGDIIRFIIMFVIFFLAISDIFNLKIIILLYIVQSIATALFLSVSESIIPQLVKKQDIGQALAQGHAVVSSGTILGGVVAGSIIAFYSIGGAILLDAITFLIASVFTCFISIKCVEEKTGKDKKNGCYSIKSWLKDLKEGYKIISRIPIELGIAIIVGALNFAFSPIDLSLLVFVKEVRQFPAWYLGLLESIMGMGGILGAVLLSIFLKIFYRDHLIVIGIMMGGLSMIFLPWINNFILPFIVMLLFGFGVAIANISLKTQSSIAMPDEYRARIVSIRGFIGAIAVPLGISIGGYGISYIGLKYTLMFSGVFVVMICPIILMIPDFSKFYRLRPDDASGYYKKTIQIIKH